MRQPDRRADSTTDVSKIQPPLLTDEELAAGTGTLAATAVADTVEVPRTSRDSLRTTERNAFGNLIRRAERSTTAKHLVIEEIDVGFSEQDRTDVDALNVDTLRTPTFVLD